jgi:hypothetical protein
LEVSMPTVEKQKALVQALVGLRPLMDLQAETTGELDAMLPAFLDRAFKGEL